VIPLILVAAIALILASAGPVLAFVPRGGVHAGGRVFVGPHFDGPHFFGPRFFGPRFFGPRFFGPRAFVGGVVVGSALWPGYYPPVYSPPVVGYAPSVPSGDYWYYCPDVRGYYPYVQQCPSGWLQVVPSPGLR